jgi:hypothetical protein
VAAQAVGRPRAEQRVRHAPAEGGRIRLLHGVPEIGVGPRDLAQQQQVFAGLRPPQLGDRRSAGAARAQRGERGIRQGVVVHLVRAPS